VAEPVDIAGRRLVPEAVDMLVVQQQPEEAQLAVVGIVVAQLGSVLGQLVGRIAVELPLGSVLEQLVGKIAGLELVEPARVLVVGCIVVAQLELVQLAGRIEVAQLESVLALAADIEVVQFESVPELLVDSLVGAELEALVRPVGCIAAVQFEWALVRPVGCIAVELQLEPAQLVVGTVGPELVERGEVPTAGCIAEFPLELVRLAAGKIVGPAVAVQRPPVGVPMPVRQRPSSRKRPKFS